MLPPLKILDKVKLNAVAASVTFSAIDTKKDQWDAVSGVTSRHLVVLVNAAGDTAANEVDLELQFNGDTGSNYGDQYLKGANTTLSAAKAESQASLTVGIISAASIANAFGGGFILIPHAFNAINHKSVLAQTGSSEYTTMITAGRWANTAAITSILLKPSSGNFAIGTELILAVVDERFQIDESLLTDDATITFDTIRQVEGDLCIIGYLRSDDAAIADSLQEDINDDNVAANYNHNLIYGNNTTAAASTSGAHPGLLFVAANNATANTFSPGFIQYFQFAQSSNDKQIVTLGGYQENGSPAADVRCYSVRWENVAAITKILFFPTDGTNFKAGSMMSLYYVPKRLLQRQTLTAAAASISFRKDVIPEWRYNEFEALQINIYTRSDEANGVNSDEVEIQINADTTAANYDYQEMTGTGAVAAAARSAASQQLVYVPANNEGANEFGGGSIIFPNYSNTVGHKHFAAVHGIGENKIAVTSFRWESTVAIYQIILSLISDSNFMIGSVFELVGILSRDSEYRLWLEDSEDPTRTLDLLDDTDQQTLDAGLQLPPPQIKSAWGGQGMEREGALLTAAKFNNRRIDLQLKYKSTTKGGLMTNIRAVQRILDDAKERVLLNFGGPVFLGFRPGDIVDEPVFFNILHGTITPPKNLWSSPLWDTNHIMLGSPMSLTCPPFGRGALVPLLPELIQNTQESTSVNYFDITPQEVWGDIPAKLFLDIRQVGASGTTKVFVAKRSGDRYNDDLWIEGEDETSTTDLSPVTTFSDEVLDAASDDAYKKAIHAGGVGNVAIFRFNYVITPPLPRGTFRVLIRSRVDTTTTQYWERVQWGFGWSYGNKTHTPTAAAGEYYSQAADDTWEILDLGLLNIPPIPESEVSPNNDFELRIFGYVTTDPAGSHWELDYIFLLPVDEGAVITSAVVNTYNLVIDGLSDPANVYLVTPNGLIYDFPEYVGKPFTLGREITRIYVLRDDVPPDVTFDVRPKYEPRYLLV